MRQGFQHGYDIEARVVIGLMVAPRGLRRKGRNTPHHGAARVHLGGLERDSPREVPPATPAAQRLIMRLNTTQNEDRNQRAGEMGGCCPLACPAACPRASWTPPR